MNSLRVLSRDEAEAVSGGTIVVVANRIFDWTSYLDSSGHFVQPNVIGMSDLSSDIGGSDEYAQVLPILAELAKILAAAGIGAYINSLFNDEVEKANAERDISSKYGNTSIVASTTTDGKLFVKGADGWWYSDRDGNGKFDTRTRESATAIEVDRGNGIVFFPKSGS